MRLEIRGLFLETLAIFFIFFLLYKGSEVIYYSPVRVDYSGLSWRIKNIQIKDNKVSYFIIYTHPQVDGDWRVELFSSEKCKIINASNWDCRQLYGDNTYMIDGVLMDTDFTYQKNILILNSITLPLTMGGVNKNKIKH